jgi:hypothetical protein
MLCVEISTPFFKRMNAYREIPTPFFKRMNAYREIPTPFFKQIIAYSDTKATAIIWRFICITIMVLDSTSL